MGGEIGGQGEGSSLKGSRQKKKGKKGGWGGKSGADSWTNRGLGLIASRE